MTISPAPPDSPLDAAYIVPSSVGRRRTRKPRRAFSLVEVVVAITVGAMAAYMFGTGFSGVYAGLDSARDLGWARRLASLQIAIFQQYGPTISGGGKLPDGTVFPAGIATAGHYTLSCDTATGVNFNRPAGAIPNLHDASINAYKLSKTGDEWHVLYAPGGVPAWLGASELATITSMGYDVQVYVSDLQINFSQNGSPVTLTGYRYYVVEVDVLRNNSFIHAVQMIFG